MYKEVIHPDLLEYPADFIVHQANCFHTMGAGIAAQIRAKYPEAYEADCRTRKGDSSKLGEYSWAKTKDNKYIFNLYSQHTFGREIKQTNYDAMVEGLERIKKVAERSISIIGHNTVVAVPYKIGCNLGGGDWKIVRAIISAIFLDSPVELVVVCRKQDL